MDLSRAIWRKSSYSGTQTNCVEIASVGMAIAARDSKDPDGPKMIISRAQWRDFVDGVKRGRTHDCCG